MYRTTKNKVVKRAALSAVLAVGTLATVASVAGASTHGHDSNGHSRADSTSGSPRHGGKDSHFGFGSTISVVSATSITVLSPQGVLTTYAIDASTTVFAGRTASTLSALAVGERVMIIPSTSAATSAGSIIIAPSERQGEGVITAVSATSITLSSKHGSRSTFSIDASTTVTKAGGVATLADLVVGERVHVVPSATSATSAASIAIVPSEQRGPGEEVEGVVTAVSSSSITVQGRHGTSSTFSIDATTSVMAGRVTGAISELAVGERVGIEPSSTASTLASLIRIDLAHVAGQVVSVTGNTIVVSNRDGFNQTIVVGPSTTYAKAGATAALSDVTTGSYIFAEGLVDVNKTSLDATSVGIGQPGSGSVGMEMSGSISMGLGGHLGGFGSELGGDH